MTSLHSILKEFGSDISEWKSFLPTRIGALESKDIDIMSASVVEKEGLKEIHLDGSMIIDGNVRFYFSAIIPSKTSSKPVSRW
jgi:hypothetical protein